MTLVLAILNALAAIPKIAGYIEAFAAAITQWWVSRQNTQTMAAIADAAALAARATTDAERYAASDAWASVLKRPRVSG